MFTWQAFTVNHAFEQCGGGVSKDAEKASDDMLHLNYKPVDRS